MADLQGTALTQYSNYSELDAQSDYNWGKQRALMAGAMPPHPNHVNQVLRELDQVAHKEDGLLNARKAEAVGDITVDLAPVSKLYHEVLPGQRREILARSARKLEEIENHRRAKLEALRSEQNELDAQLRAVRERIGTRPLRQHLNAQLYYAALSLFAIAEVPINSLAFEIFFGNDPITCIAIATGLGALLIIFCHFIGINIRRTSTNSPMALAARISTSVLLFSLCMVIVLVLTKFRELVVAAKKAGNVTFDFSEAIRQGSKQPSISEFVLNIKLDGIGQALFILNLAILIAGVMLAFYRHDPDTDFELISKRRDKLGKVVAEANAQYGKARSDLIAVRDRELRGNQDSIAEAGQKLSALQARLRATEDEFKSLRDFLWSVAMKRREQAYRGYYDAVAPYLQHQTQATQPISNGPEAPRAGN